MDFTKALKKFDRATRTLITERNLQYVCEDWKGQFAVNVDSQQAAKAFLEDLESGVAKDVPLEEHKKFWLKYTKPEDLTTLLALKDRLVDIGDRRYDGEFFTPLSYAKQAHDYLQEAFGEIYERHWWDMCCGTGNLTHHCPSEMHERLYLSTLNQEDVDIIVRSARFPNANVFALDFLNAEDYVIHLGNHKWLFILNPPYSAAPTVRDEHKEGVSDTRIGNEMRALKLGKAAQNLTAQFLYRIASIVKEHNTDVIIGMFTQPSFVTNPGFKPLYQQWRNVFGFKGGFCFHCSEFEGTTGEWPVLFTMWESQPNGKPVEVDVFEQRMLVGKKVFGGTENPMNKWVERPKNIIEYPPFTSAITVATQDKTINLTKLPEKAYGFAVYAGNDVMHSKQAFILSAPYANGSGWGITIDNFEESLVCVGSRAIIKGTWLNDRDQFSAPNTSHEKYFEFQDNLIAWLLFSNFNHSSSIECSFEGIDYDIKNHFFWRQGTVTSDWLFATKGVLWEESIAVIDYCDKLYDECQNLRHEGKADPKYQVHRADAGWYQIRKAFYSSASPYPELPPLYKQYKQLHKALTQKLIPYVYEMGVLPREVFFDKLKNSKNKRLHRLA